MNFLSVLERWKQGVDSEELDSLIRRYWLNHGLDSELDELSSHTRISEVEDVILNDFHAGDTEIAISGSGTVVLSLQHGSDGDQERDMGSQSCRSIDFRFKGTLNHNLSIIDLITTYAIVV